jgi:hypothetical protein
VIALAVGHAVTVGVVFEVVPPPLLPPHPAIQEVAKTISQIAGCRPIIFIGQPLLIYLLFPCRNPGSYPQARLHLRPALPLPETGLA